MIWIALFCALVAMVLFWLAVTGSDKSQETVEKKSDCADCPAHQESDPVRAVALVMAALHRHCGKADADPQLLQRVMEPLAGRGDIVEAAEFAASSRCSKLETTLGLLAPAMVSHFRFVERGQIVAMANTIIAETGGGDECRKWVLPLLRRKLALSAR